ncbi:Rho GTPase-activating protein 9 [Clonorchis sinensis]|uniref:Rho GTPase-activating protein 9 n=1 Tax=Clonorchis sinensis TaxID=79923 RepID=A0A8T1MD45_CLOSI|nr:Rho GTPase-activating protein 9 [Clonorchis sinensis]
MCAKMTTSLKDQDDTCIESRTPKANQGKPEDLEDSLNQYANWLADAVTETPEFRQFCELWPARFVELCKFHLSVLIDLPLEVWDDSTKAVCGANVVGSKKLFPELVSREPVVSRLITNGHLRRTPKPWARLRGTTPNVERADAENSRYAIHRPNRVQHGTSGGLNNKTCANEAIVQNLLSLMDALDNKENLANEGIFRKTGNMQRQRCVRRRIMTEKQLDIQSLMYCVEPKPWKPAGVGLGNRRWIQSHLTQSVPASAPPSPMVGVHDLAAALKGVLYDLPEPLLTDRLLPLFVQVASLTSGRLDDRGRRITLRPIEEKIASAKQLKAVRLLCRLLPETHEVLFKRLLVLLEHTLQYASSNRMTAESLGLLFGPVLFSPSKVPTRDLHTQYTNLARLATMMITQGVNGLWYIPKSFLQDVERNRLLYMELTLPPIADRDNSSLSSASLPSLQNDYTTSILERANSNDSGLGLTDGSQPSSDMDSAVVPPLRVDELPALVTCINFTVRHSSDKDHMANGETEYAVAELCAAVQSLPDNDPRKRRLVNRFNATNGGLLPPTSGTGVRKHTTPHSSLCRQIPRLNRDWSASLGDVSSGRFIRAHTGNSAFKAAKTIRSSLRRRLALRSNVSVTGCFNSPRNLVKPLIECRSEMDFEYSQSHLSVDRNPGALAHITDHPQMLDCGHQLSPIFDTNCRPEVFGSCESLNLPAPPETIMAANTRCSIMSTTSISSVGAGDLLFCCPLVEAIASPFRKLTTPSSQGRTPDSMHSGVTPLARVFRGGFKRLRGRSPRIGLLRNEVISFIPPLRCDEETPVDSYYPIEFDEPLGAKLKNSECLYEQIDRPVERISGRSRRRPIRQKTITSFGYRTVAHISCQSPMDRSIGHHLRRSQTMPSIPWLFTSDKKAEF